VIYFSQIPSPLIRSIIFSQVISFVGRSRKLPSEPIPFLLAGRSIDVLAMLKSALLCFDVPFVQSSVRQCYKISQVSGLRDVEVPKEEVYQAELQRLLSMWLHGVSVIPQHNMGGNSRCDLVISPLPSHRIVVELVATVPINGVVDHFSQVRDYCNILQAQYAWVFHFTMKAEDENFKYPYPDPLSGVQVLHIYHNYDFDNVRVQYMNSEKKIVTEDIVMK